MHKCGLERLAQLKWAILETDGKISIVPADSESGAKGSKPDEKDPL